MKVRMLGCGGSGGVPLVGGEWGACDPAEPRNRRRRASLLVETASTTILIDTSPDCRQQLLDAGTRRLDAVLYSHAHADHLHGIDDLRALNRLMRRPIAIHADVDTMATIRRRFDYVFTPIEPGGSFYKPTAVANIIQGPFVVGDIRVVPFSQDHGFSTTLGFRIGPVAYSTDVVELDDKAFAALDGVAVWIVDCLRYEPHPTHSHLEKTLRWIERVKPRRAILTHMDVPLDYATLRRKLPAGVEPGYDGLTVDFGETRGKDFP
ncbi:MAG TPA: MBL fold metallo-hydrolase [Stellaceae bacterium]|nr:MBL fold metallo-hydrolase [Stellaceae bacterium]